MSDFDWVSERNDCSVAVVFEALKSQIEDDIETRNSLRGEFKYYGFSAAVQGDSIVVIREGNKISGSVKFLREDDKISVYDAERELIMEATLTLNNEGKCRLRIRDQEFELWQFRKLALEDLFLGSSEWDTLKN